MTKVRVLVSDHSVEVKNVSRGAQQDGVAEAVVVDKIS